MIHFSLIGKLNPAPVVEALAEHEAMWGDIRWRQETPGTPHTDTHTIFLRMPPVIDLESVFQSLDVTDCAPMAVPAFGDAVRRLSDMILGEPARAMLVRLAPGGHITPHIDAGAYAEATNRYHWCVSTDGGCWMRSGYDFVAAQPGEVWWFDKHAEHEVKNNGTTPRVHLILDCWR